MSSVSSSPTPPSTNPSPPPGDGSASALAGGPSPLTVGKHFIKQYYQVLSTTPDQIYRFYKPASVLSSGEGSNPTEPSPFETFGGTDRWGISDADKTTSKGMRIELENGAIDAQQSMTGGILLVVTGHVVLISKKKQEERKAFVHVFFLATHGPNAKRFYVHNDILRFLQEGELPLSSLTTVDAGVATTDEMKLVQTTTLVEPKPVDNDEPKEKNAKEGAPGGGVEETKEVVAEEEEEVPVADQKVDVEEKPAPVVVEEELAAEETKEEPAPESQVAAKDKSASAAKAKKPNRGGRRASPPQQPPQVPQQPAPKPVPGSWASLVASGGPTVTASAPNSMAANASMTSPAKVKAAVAPAAPAPEKKPKESASGAAAESKPAASSSRSEQEKGDTAASNNNKDNNKDSKIIRGGDRPKRDPDNTLVIKNLPDNTKESEIVALFEPFAKQTNSKIVGATVSNHRQLAFVDYDSVAAVLAAVELHAKEPMKLNGRILEVDQKTAEQRARRTMRGGGYQRSGSPGNGGAYQNRGGAGGDRGGAGGDRASGGRHHQFKRGGDREGGGRGRGGDREGGGRGNMGRGPGGDREGGGRGGRGEGRAGR
jgi:hypothetical protein